MPLERARTIDELSTAAGGADIALSTEAPLTLALDRRVQEPRLGRVAATPRSHASGELVPLDQRPLFHSIVTDSDMPWKTAVRSLDLCLDCWDRTGSLDAILEYPEFDTPGVRETVSYLDRGESSYRALAQTQLSSADDICVIDEQSMTALDRSILPDNPGHYRSVRPFTDEGASLPEVHLYQSATAIVDAVVDQLSAETADRVGIVLDQGTAYSSLIEAALEARGIPYQGGPGFVDTDDVRVFLRLLQTCFAGATLPVSEVRPLLTAAGLTVPRRYDEQRVDISAVETDLEAFSHLQSVRSAVSGGTFDRALGAFEDLIGRSLSTLRTELSALGLLTAPVTEQRVNSLVYYLQTFEVPVDRESEGVLLTDAGSTAYVDRPVVFYLGLGDGWAKRPPDLPWVDDVTFTERDLRRFKLLVQNGQQRYILAQPTRAGEEVTPCPYLQTVLEGQHVESLADLPNVTRHDSAESSRTDAAFPEPARPATVDRVETLSNSRLKTLVTSPRDYYFDQLVETPTNYPMQRGSVLHDAAELYVNAPEWVTDEELREQLLDEMCDQVTAYVSDVRQPTVRSTFDVGLDVIDAYLRENPPQKADYQTYGSSASGNDLADALGVDVESALCERWFETEEVGAHGVVDLLQNPQTVVDYKSGSVSSATDIQGDASIQDISDTPDFQVLMYLAQHRRERPDERLEMRFVHLLGMESEMVKGEPPDFDTLVTTLTYVPSTFSAFVASRPMFEQLTDYADSNDRCKVLDTLGFDQYRQFFTDHRLPRPETDPDRRETIEAGFLELAREEVGNYKYVDEGVDKIFDDLTEPEGYILKDDLDAFERFLADRLDDLDEYRKTRFPVAFNEEEPNWDRVDHRDCILTEGER